MTGEPHGRAGMAGKLVGKAIRSARNVAHTEEADFLPDFLVGFLLLHRSGLDANERGNILAALRGEFSVNSVAKALREQWADEDLMKRDRRKEQSLYTAYQDEISEDHEAALEPPDAAQVTAGAEVCSAIRSQVRHRRNYRQACLFPLVSHLLPAPLPEVSRGACPYIPPEAVNP